MNRIKGLTIEIGGDTTKLQDALKGVNSKIKDTQAQLKDVNKLLKLDPGNTELIAQKQRLLGEAIDQTKQKLVSLKEAQKQAQQALANGDISQAQYDALQREIVETEQELRNLEEQARQTGRALGEHLQEAGQQMQAVGDKVYGVGQKMAGVGDKMTMRVTAPIVAGATVMVKKFAEVDKIMALTNKTMNNSEEQAKLLQKAMEEAAANSIFGMNDAANAALNFARAGLTAEEAAATLAPAMNLAAGEGGNLDTVSQGLVATINGFGDEFGQAAHYADIFAAACNNSALDVDSLSEAMSVAAPIFRTAGYSVDDAALYMGVMANNGIEASVAANSLKTGLARLIKPAKEGKIAMEEMGLRTVDALGNVSYAFENADGSMKSTIEVQKLLHDSFAKLSETEQIAAASAIFGKNQMATWLALINTAPADVQALSDSLMTAKGTTDEMSEAMMSGFGGSLEKLKSSLDVLMTSLGGLISEYLVPLVEKLQGAVDWLLSLDEGTQKMIIEAAAFAAAIGPILSIMGRITMGGGTIIKGIGMVTEGVGKMIPLLTGAAGGASGAAGGLAAIGAAAPVILAVVAAVAAVGAALYTLWTTNDAFRESVLTGLEQLKETFTNLVEGLLERFETVKAKFVEIEEATGIFSGIWEVFCTYVGTVFEYTFGQLVVVFESVTDTLLGILDFWIGVFTGDWDMAFKGMMETVEGITTLITGTIQNMVRLVANILGGAKWELPKIKMPHFSIDGEFSLNPPRVPHISVEWYRRAYDDAMILSKPTIFGMANGHLLGGGDGPGSETVVGTDKLMGMIAQAVGASGGGDIIIPVSIGTEPIEEIVVRANERMSYRRGQ